MQALFVLVQFSLQIANIRISGTIRDALRLIAYQKKRHAIESSLGHRMARENNKQSITHRSRPR